MLSGPTHGVKAEVANPFFHPRLYDWCKRNSCLGLDHGRAETMIEVKMRGKISIEKQGGVRILIIVLGVVVLSSLPGLATPPSFQIIIESASPYYLPASARVAPGSPIRWDNPTPSHHTVTHDGCLTEEPCAFDSGSLPPNESYTLPGLPPGRYSYHCRLHPIMRGTLTVTDPVAAPSET